jgi:hypothetical protein
VETTIKRGCSVMNYFEFFMFRQKLVRVYVLVARETRRERQGTTAGWKVP